MPTEVTQSAVLDGLIQEMRAGDIAISEAIKLSSPLVLTACLLYIMASDGAIQEQESSQLQQVIGGNDGLLAHALAYVKAFPVEKFLEDAPSVLGQQDKLCILANVCDSMLSDGSTDAKELEIFNTFREAFDLQKSDVDLIFEAIRLKNNKDVFGDFEPVTSDKLSDLTPHLAMAVSIVYMMSADGSIGQEEIGQLETMVGEFEGLQQIALQFVRKTKRSDFLNEAKHVLDKRQKMCVLLNVCDSMMADESVGILEDKLFVSMLDAFSVKESAFKKYYEVLELKNIKPFDVSSFAYSIEHVRTLSQQEQKGIVVEGLDDQSEVGVGIQRTMDSNTEKVTNDFGSKDNIQKVQDNATHALERQRGLDIKVDPNLQKVLSGSDSEKNIQTIGDASDSSNLKITLKDGRVENLQKVVDELSEKLNKFEARNKSLLNNARANISKEASKEQTFAKQANDINKAKIAGERVKDNLQPINSGSIGGNQAGVAKEAIKDNLQSAAEKVKEANTVAIAKEAVKENKQVIASPSIVANKAGVAKEAIEDNLQSVPDKANNTNKATAKKEAINDNLESVQVKPVDTNDVRVAKAGFVTNFQLVAHVGQIFEASGATTSVECSLDGDDSDTLETNSAEAFANQAKSELTPSTVQNKTDSIAVIESRFTLKKKQSPFGALFSNKLPSKYSLKLYARVLATFFVMSLWTSSIDATRLDMGNMVFGHLQRISPDPLDLQ